MPKDPWDEALKCAEDVVSLMAVFGFAALAADALLEGNFKALGELAKEGLDIVSE